MRNERGSTLILVLLVSLILITIGLTIFSITINGTKQTEIRKTDVATIQGSIGTMNEIITEFKQSVSNLSKNASLEDLLQTGAYETKLNTIIAELSLKYKSKSGISLQIEDESAQLFSDSTNDYTNKYFTREYKFSLHYVNNTNQTQPDIEKTITRNVYVSPTPSFLQYAVGSEETLNLNGASDIVGNVYGDTINVADAARYVNERAKSNLPVKFTTTEAPYPAITGDVVVNKTLQAFDNGTKEDGTAINRFSKYALAVQNKQTFLPYFYTKDNQVTELPSIRKSYDSFVSVDFPKTFSEKLNNLTIDGKHLSITKEQAQAADLGSIVTQNIWSLTGGPSSPNDISSFNTSSHSVYVIDKTTNPADISKDFTTAPYSSKNVIVVTNVPGAANSLTDNYNFVINSNLKLDRNQWLVVNGNLEIYSNGTPISIEGNILVMGNIIIHGNDLNLGRSEQDQVSFNSTIYSTGKATIYSTDIVGIDDRQLVLLAQDDLLITRINEFDSTDSDIKPMDAYLYTDKHAELYGVGSLFKIHGGIFAKHELTINAIRQNNMIKPGVDLSNPSENTTVLLSLDSKESQKGQASRFIVEYNKSILLNQVDALPSVNTLQVFVDDYTISGPK